MATATEATLFGGGRIDHILVTPGVEIVVVRLAESRASDHRPLVAVVRVDEQVTE